MAAFAEDADSFALEIGEALILPARIATQVVNDPGGEPLACAARALDMPSAGVPADIDVPQSRIRRPPCTMSTGCRGSTTG